MTSLTDLREVVDVVIGVDTHVHSHVRTHSAAVVDGATGGVEGKTSREIKRCPARDVARTSTAHLKVEPQLLDEA